MEFKLRFLQPFQTDYLLANADNLADAACDVLGSHRARALFIEPCDAGRDDGDTTFFATMQSEGGESFITRYFFSGIGRRGGVKPSNLLRCRSIEEAEKRLGLKVGALMCDWLFEESSDQAWHRNLGRHSIPRAVRPGK